MKPILMAGTTIVVGALIAYSVGIITEQRKRVISKLVITALSIGVFLDVVATVCMIIGSENSAFSPHGILGYSSLGAMVTDTALAWKHRIAHGEETVPKGLHLYSRIAYLWWVAAFITGGLMVAISKM